MRPNETEYAPYYQKYIDTVEGDDIIWVLDKQINEFIEFINTIPEEKKNYSYAAGKWTTVEVLGHIIDTERIMAFRAFWFARNAANPLPGFEQDDFIKSADLIKSSCSNPGNGLAAFLANQNARKAIILSVSIICPRTSTVVHFPAAYE